nr:alpha/beta hydrolase [Patescibacteria group bacterium]
PILVLHGECDFIPLEARQEYVETFPHATLMTIPHTGHAIIGTEPALAKKMMDAFLLDQPLPAITETK